MSPTAALRLERAYSRRLERELAEARRQLETLRLILATAERPTCPTCRAAAPCPE